MEKLVPGLKAEALEEVRENLTARALGSGGLPVFSTPMLVALMERASLSAVAPYLNEGCSTVGTMVQIKHTSATPVGASVRAEGILKEIDGRRLVFEVRAWDGAGTIGEGTHERFIIDNEKFLSKTNSKKL
ncbi:MAG: thioesterase family protein [Spirochaetaceae bacterium]|jgi:predicted thioesterase|nr:thioesterase family protein [Spirochaetaceae bacterium]GMO20964.1 MAG: thioesterase family protein [Termitinemataceae bacterium]